MYIVWSTNGNWESDMCGVVGQISDITELTALIAKREQCEYDQADSNFQVVDLSGEEDNTLFDELYEEEELCLLSEGSIVAYAGYKGTYYFVDDVSGLGV